MSVALVAEGPAALQTSREGEGEEAAAADWGIYRAQRVLLSVYCLWSWLLSDFLRCVGECSCCAVWGKHPLTGRRGQLFLAEPDRS